MERFSLDKWILGRFSYDEFMHAAEKVIRIVTETHPNLHVEVRTCEDMRTHLLNQVTLTSDEVVAEALAARPQYTLTEFTGPVWERAFDVELSLRDPTATERHFMILLSINRHEEPRSLRFYMQGIEEGLRKQIERQFARPNHYYKIGDGFPRSSEFSRAFGRRLMRSERPHHL